MKKNKIICIFLIHILCAGFVNGQFNPHQPPTLPQAPNTATLGKFGDYPVSHFTGVPGISIPLHSIKTNGFEVPINLSYHASGIKLYDFPSWVGSGWALSAGGNIRRSLVGLPDEQANGLMSGHPQKALDLDPSDLTDIEYFQQLNGGFRDIGADIFSYSFPGGDGKFFFDADSSYKPVLLPYAPIKIQHNGSSSITFKLTDAAGNKYEFGDNAAELTHSLTVGGSSSYTTSAWMLEKMISATNKDTIHFTYQSQYDATPWERSDTWFVDDMVDHYAFYTTPDGGGCMEQDYPYSPNAQAMDPTYTYSEMYSYQNQEIRYNNGKIVFELDASDRQDFDQSDNSKALKRIKVYQTTPSGYELFKTIVFYHGYFIDGSDPESMRLRLDSLQTLDQNSQVVGLYKFDYNTTVNLPAPALTTMAKDYWGYYNGRSNTSLVPQATVSQTPYPGSSSSTVTIGSTNSIGREPDSVNMQAAILKRIYYPTKGYTDFEYEANRYLDTNNVLKLAGGLRIKSIKSYDGINATPLTKTYKYGASESGNGKANFAGGDFYFSEEQPYEFWQRVCEGSESIGILNDKKRRRTFYSNPTVSFEPFDGAPVFYPTVTEYTGEGSTVLGKTIYKYRDSIDIVDHITYSSKPVIQSKYYARGQLLNQKVYKSTGSGFQLIQEQKIGYNTGFPFMAKRGGLTLKERIVREHLTPYTPAYTSNDWFHMNYYITTDDNYPVADTMVIYDADEPSRYAQTIKTYGYGGFAHQQPISVTTINSKGETIIAETRYPADYISSGTTTGNAVLDTMLSKHMQAYPVEQWTRKSSGSWTLNGGVNLYTQAGSGLVVLDKQKRLQIAVPVNDYTPASIVSTALQADSRYTTMLNFPLYNSKGNILEIQKENDIKETYLWGYNGQYPVAKITGSNYSTASSYITQSVLDNPSNDYVLRSHLNNLRTNLVGLPVTTYTYRPGTGVTSETDARGRTTYYVYDNAGRLSFIRDQDNNVIKKFCYNYAGQPENCSCATTTPSWQNTSTALRCKKNGSNENTGEQEQEQFDRNPCSSTYNQLQWVVTGTNTTTCPVPCNIYTCTGENKKCVGGNCETGIKVYTAAEYDYGLNVWICYYHYEFSDSSWSSTYTEQSPTACYFS